MLFFIYLLGRRCSRPGKGGGGLCGGGFPKYGRDTRIKSSTSGSYTDLGFSATLSPSLPCFFIGGRIFDNRFDDNLDNLTFGSFLPGLKSFGGDDGLNSFVGDDGEFGDTGPSP